MNKKFLKFSLVLCASIVIAISCTKKDENPTNPELPSIGTLTAKAGILTLQSASQTGQEVSGAIEVSGFSEGFKADAKAKTDITYKVKTVTVTAITTTGPAAKDLDALKKAIAESTFKVESPSKFDNIVIGFTGDKAADNAKAIAAAITKGKTGNIILTVEASPAGSTAGKYTATTFEVRLGIQVTGN